MTSLDYEPRSTIISPPNPVGQNDNEVRADFPNIRETTIMHESWFVDGAAGAQNHQLGFEAKSVRITNLTHQWWYADFLDSYIPPLIYGLVMNLPHGVQACKIRPETPVTQASTATTNEPMVLTFFNIGQYPSPGVLGKVFA